MAVRMWMMLMLLALGAAPATAQDSVYSVVSADARFSTLKLLIDALDGTDATQPTFDALTNSASALTVFAPTNTAIGNWILANFGTVDEATDNLAFLAELLTYHVVGSKVVSSDLSVDMSVQPLLLSHMFNISSLDPPTIKTASSQTVLITEVDITAGDSVIHVVDHVLDPKGGAFMFGGETRLLTTEAVAASTGSHAILLDVLTALGDTYVGLATGTANKLMVVAPNDDAFTKFVTDANTTLDALLAEVNLTTLKSVINYHVFYDTSATVQGANGMSPNPLLAGSSATWMAGVNLAMMNEMNLTVTMKSDSEWTLVTPFNQTVTSSLLATSSGFLMPVTEVLSPTAPAPAETPPGSGSSLYHVSMLTVASALMAVFGMVVAV